MTININFEEEVEEKDQPEGNLKFKMAVRKSMDGRIMISDHPDIDIVLIPEKRKVVVFAKETFGDHVYASQNIFFNYLSKKGVVAPESVKGGNVYGSLEAKISESNNKVDPIKFVLLVTSKFLEEEKEHFKSEQDQHRLIKKYLTNPPDEHSTELGEVPHAERKGSIYPGTRPYNFGASFGVYEE